MDLGIPPSDGAPAAASIFSAGVEAQAFETATIGIMVLDLRRTKALFGRWRAEGAVDLPDWLAARPGRDRELAETTVILKANAKALFLYGVPTLEALRETAHGLFCEEALPSCADFYRCFWTDGGGFQSEILICGQDGTRRDVVLSGKLATGAEQDWSCATAALVDRTAEKQAQRRLAQSEAFARALFEQSPVSIWAQDYSGVKAVFDRLRAEGVTDLRTYLDGRMDLVQDFMSRVKIVDVNRQALEMYGARTKEELINGLGRLVVSSSIDEMVEELVAMYNGNWRQQLEMQTGTLHGKALDVLVRLSVVPGYEEDWSLVLLAVMDVTARRKAESRLRYISNHDELSGLRNRVFYVEALARLEADGPLPVTVIIADLNRLKAVNDLFGHAAGDAMLRRAGEILRFAVSPPGEVARIGGDEFAVLLPGTDEQGGAWMMGQIEALIAQNNEVYRAGALSLSMGMATFRRGTGPDADSLDATVRRADLAMYESKRAFHAGAPDDDRRRDVYGVNVTT